MNPDLNIFKWKPRWWVLGGGGVCLVLWVVAVFHSPPDHITDKAPDLPVATSRLPGVQIVPSAVDRILPAVRNDGVRVQQALPPSLKLVLDPESTLSFQKRLAAVHGLPASLRPEESRSLLTFVQSGSYPRGFSPSQNMALVNDILNVLQRQEEIRSDLVALLEELSANPANPPVIRDYALQHLASLALASAEDQKTTDKGQRVSLLQAQWRTLENDDPLLASGAMLRLLAASRQDMLEPAERRRLEKAALDLASDSKVPNPARITALQVCGQLGMADAKHVAYSLASSENESFPLRVAAVATLGQVLDSKDVEMRQFLQTLSQNREKRLRVPALEALNGLVRWDSTL